MITLSTFTSSKSEYLLIFRRLIEFGFVNDARREKIFIFNTYFISKYQKKLEEEKDDQELAFQKLGRVLIDIFSNV